MQRTIIVLTLLSAVAITVVALPATQSQIYAQAFERIISIDDTYGGQLSPTKIYLLRKVVNFPDALFDGYSDLNEVLSADVISVLEETASTLGVALYVVASEADLQYNDLGEVEGGGVVVVFGQLRTNVIFAEVSAVIHVAAMATGGTRYSFVRYLGNWNLIGSHMTFVT
jgi:hypothetical protein